MSYCTDEQMLAVVTKEGYTLTDADKAKAQRFADVTARVLDSKLKRSFNKVHATRKYDAVPNSVLYLPDEILAEPAPVIKVKNVDLLPGEDHDYVLLLNEDGTAYDQAIRIVAGERVPWSFGVSGLRQGQVEFTGDFAYAATVPPEVVQVNLEMAVAMWKAEVLDYTGDGGGGVFGNEEAARKYYLPRHADMLAHLYRTIVVQAVG